LLLYNVQSSGTGVITTPRSACCVLLDVHALTSYYYCFDVSQNTQLYAPQHHDLTDMVVTIVEVTIVDAAPKSRRKPAS
jgi:hypothetical protein